MANSRTETKRKSKRWKEAGNRNWFSHPQM